MTYTRKEWIVLIICFMGAMIFTWRVKDNFFFWDTVQLASRHATHFYTHGLWPFLLPESFDSGHIPGFGAALALIWSLFGRSLEVSHYFMLPFMLGIIWHVFHLCREYISSPFHLYASILILLDPTLLGQAGLVSPDIVLIFLFLSALRCVLNGKNLCLAMVLILLSFTSLRGVITCFSLLLFQAYYIFSKDGRGALLSPRWVLVYLPAFLLFLSYSLYHYSMTGWVYFHSESPWSDSFQRSGLWETLRNVGILGWRLIDFGRLALWILVTGLFLRGYRRLISIEKVKLFSALSISLLIGMALVILGFKGLMGHRYLLPFYLSFAFLCALLIDRSALKSHVKKTLFLIGIVGLISGHFWIYPPHIAQGWEASLAYLPFFELMEETEEFLIENDIEKKRVATTFPILGTEDELKLNGSESRFKSLNQKDADYYLYSNVLNDYPDSLLHDLLDTKKPLYEIQKRQIYIHIYDKE